MRAPLVIDDTYRLVEALGSGGTGTVYRARDLRRDRLVALKLVPAGLLAGPVAHQRFRSDAQRLAGLRHPAIVSTLDSGVLPDGGAYLVMELVRGHDLRHVLQQEGRLESTRAIGILSDVCAAIEAAHREGVLHLDLKPENILLPEGEQPPKVVDFGVAGVLAHDRDETAAADAAATATTAGTIVGTPAYMAPEQFRAAAVDARADVFSLGVVAYEMLAGELPFGRGSLTDIVLAQSRGARAMGAGIVPPALERAVRAALEPEPDRRPASAQAFAHLLGAAADT